MVGSGTVQLNDFKILNQQQSLTPEGLEFPFVHSTPLYPELPFAAHPSVHWQV